jgi:type IV pilus biogenesis protein CpaD/CtpE
MLERSPRTLVVLALSCALLSGCANAQQRQQAAYARYVKKFSHNRIKQKKKFKVVKMPAPPPASNIGSGGTNDYPHSVSSSSGN